MKFVVTMTRVSKERATVELDAEDSGHARRKALHMTLEGIEWELREVDVTEVDVWQGRLEDM